MDGARGVSGAGRGVPARRTAWGEAEECAGGTAAAGSRQDERCLDGIQVRLLARLRTGIRRNVTRSKKIDSRILG